MSKDFPVRVPRDSSRSRAYWELQKRLGPEEAAARWPEALRDLRAMQPELSSLVTVDRTRERPRATSYREPASSSTRLRLRSSGKSTKRGLLLAALGVAQFAFGVWSSLGIFSFVLGGFALVSGVSMLSSRWRGDTLEIDARRLQMIRAGRVQAELDRSEIAFVEVRSVDDEQLVLELGIGTRMALHDKTYAASWVCVWTKGGDLLPLGRPVDEEAATALCAALEDELGLLPEAAPGPPRVRVAAPDEQQVPETVPMVEPVSSGARDRAVE